MEKNKEFTRRFIRSIAREHLSFTQTLMAIASASSLRLFLTPFFPSLPSRRARDAQSGEAIKIRKIFRKPLNKFLWLENGFCFVSAVKYLFKFTRIDARCVRSARLPRRQLFLNLSQTNGIHA